MEKTNKDKCLKCKIGMCQKNCPLGNDIPKIIEHMQNNEYERAYKTLLQTSVMPNILSKVCTHNCENNCVRSRIDESIQIQTIERNLVEYAQQNDLKYLEILKENIEEKEKTKEKQNKINEVVIIGSGPAGLSCAIYLKLFGFDVEVIEKQKKIGGLLRYGIPEFRLEKNEVEYLEQKATELGIKFTCGNLFDLDLKQLSKDKFVVLATGLDDDIQVATESENVLNGKKLLVNFAKQRENEAVEEIDFSGKKVAVLGGGNVAIDVAQTLKKKGANPVIIYRRAREQMPALNEEVELCLAEGIEIMFNTDFESFDGNVLTLHKTNPTKDRKEKTTKIEGSEFNIEIEYFVNSIGSKMSDKLKKYLEGFGVVTNGNKVCVTDFETSLENVFAIGDIIGIDQTIATASRSGLDCAKKIRNVN